MLRENTSELGLGGVLLDAPAEAPAREEAAAEAPAAWSPAKRIAFRFLFSYFFLYIFPFPFDYVPYAEKIFGPYLAFWNWLIPKVGDLIHAKVTAQPNGSGDTTYNYVQLLCYLVISAVAALVWSVLDRRRTQYAWLYRWLRVYVRFSLATAMISYGAFKVIKSQFPAPTLDRLMQPFGDASPMGLLWTFMGASKAYTFFGGFSEFVGGVLLVFRRTTLLGALVSSAVLVNIVMLNFSYDVPVKLYSTNLLLMGLFLAAPDVRRLLDLFVLNRPVAPAEDPPLFRRKRLHYGALALRAAFVLYVVYFSMNLSYQGAVKYGDMAPKPPLYGIWNVEELVVNGQAQPALLTDGTRWRRVVFSFPEQMGIQLMDDSRKRFNLKLDPVKHTLALTRRGDEKGWKAGFSYQQPEPRLLMLDGTFDGKQVRAKLRQVDPKKFLLMTRGFHWVNEYPFNR